MFFSPSLNQLTPYCCFQSISSCFQRSSSCFMSGPSSSTISFDLPSMIICSCTVSILFFNSSWSFKMLPKSSLFHFLILCLISFSLSWNVCIRFLPTTSLFFYHSSSCPNSSGSQIQNDSNLKGLFLGPILRSISSLTSQCYESIPGRMEVSMYMSLEMTCSETKNRSNLDTILSDCFR